MDTTVEQTGNAGNGNLMGLDLIDEEITAETASENGDETDQAEPEAEAEVEETYECHFGGHVGDETLKACDAVTPSFQNISRKIEKQEGGFRKLGVDDLVNEVVCKTCAEYLGGKFKMNFYPIDHQVEALLERRREEEEERKRNSFAEEYAASFGVDEADSRLVRSVRVNNPDNDRNRNGRNRDFDRRDRDRDENRGRRGRDRRGEREYA